MRLAELYLVNGVGQPGLLRFGKGVGQAGVVGLHAQQAAQERPVGAVPRAGLGKGAVEVDGGLDRGLAQQGAGHGADARRPGGVGAGGADHHRAQYLENVQHSSNSFQSVSRVLYHMTPGSTIKKTAGKQKAHIPGRRPGIYTYLTPQGWGIICPRRQPPPTKAPAEQGFGAI